MKKVKSKNEIFKPTVNFPINDTQAWTRYPQFRWLYNKIKICEIQNINHAPMPIETTKFPVVLKPIINLYGMGHNAYKINNLKEFYKYWHSNGFWMECFSGNHYSYDIIILNGKIVFNICFLGISHPKVFGAFSYWESLNQNEKKIPESIQKIIQQHLQKFTGILNVECIGDFVIECHLRMGDLHELNNRILVESINLLYKKHIWNYKSPLDIRKIYLIPVWSKTKVIPTQLLSEKIMNNLCKHKSILTFKIDTGFGSNPENIYRIANLTSTDLKIGFNTRDSIYQYISDKKNANILINKSK